MKVLKFEGSITAEALFNPIFSKNALRSAVLPVDFFLFFHVACYQALKKKILRQSGYLASGDLFCVLVLIR